MRASDLMCPSGSAAYYELHVVRMGESLQWGFCTRVFQRHDTDSEVADDNGSWGVDGDRLLKWHEESTPLGGRQWRDGDVIGLACDLRADKYHAHTKETNQSGTLDQAETGQTGGSIWVSLNGDFSPPYGLAFRLPQDLSGLFAAFTAESGVVKCNLGEEAFAYAPPGEGFEPMCFFPAPAGASCPDAK